MANTSANNWTEHEFKVMDQVRLVSDPSMVGMICDIAPMGDITRYSVFLNGEIILIYV